MFCFGSKLVEEGYFKQVNINFLVNGHTHCPVDQYFSCLKNRFRACSFVASPLALMHLFSLSPSEFAKFKKKTPKKEKQVKAVEDKDLDDELF